MDRDIGSQPGDEEWLLLASSWETDWMKSWGVTYLWHWWQLCLWVRPELPASSSPLGWGGGQPCSIPPVRQGRTPPLLRPCPVASETSWRAEICHPPAMKRWTDWEKDNMLMRGKAEERNTRKRGKERNKERGNMMRHNERQYIKIASDRSIKVITKNKCLYNGIKGEWK